MTGFVHEMPMRDGKPRDFTFVKSSDGKQYFLHISDFKKGNWKILSKGPFPIKVEFEPATNTKGLKATNAGFAGEK